MVVKEVLVERNTGAVPHVLGLLPEAPLGEAVDAPERLVIAGLMGLAGQRQQPEKQHVDSEVALLHLTAEVGEEGRRLAPPVRHVNIPPTAID